MRELMQIIQSDIKGYSAIRDFGWMCLFQILFASMTFSGVNYLSNNGFLDLPNLGKDEFVIYILLSLCTTTYQVYIKKSTLFLAEKGNLKNK